MMLATTSENTLCILFNRRLSRKEHSSRYRCMYFRLAADTFRGNVEKMSQADLIRVVFVSSVGFSNRTSLAKPPESLH